MVKPEINMRLCLFFFFVAVVVSFDTSNVLYLHESMIQTLQTLIDKASLECHYLFFFYIEQSPQKLANIAYY